MSECSSDLYKPPKGLVNSSCVIEFGGPHAEVTTDKSSALCI